MKKDFNEMSAKEKALVTYMELQERKRKRKQLNEADVFKIQQASKYYFKKQKSKNIKRGFNI